MSALGRRTILKAALLPALPCCGVWRLRKYGLEGQSTYEGGWVRRSDPDLSDFRLDKIFWLRGAHLPDRLWQPRPGSPEDGKYHANFCNLLDSAATGKQRYLVAYRFYLDACCDDIFVATFYALIGVRGDDPDPARSVLVFSGGEPGNEYYHPRRIQMTPGEDVRILVDAGPPVESVDDRAPRSFVIEGHIDPDFTLRDYHAHADEMRRRNCDTPSRNPCPDK